MMNTRPDEIGTGPPQGFVKQIRPSNRVQQRISLSLESVAWWLEAGTGGLVFKDHRLSSHSTLGSKVIKNKKREKTSVAAGVDVLVVQRLPRS